MTVNYSQISPYFKTKQTTWYLDFYEHRSIPPHGTDKQIIIKQKYHKRPDLLAKELYNDTKYMFVFALCNMDIIKDPINDFVEGIVITIPTYERVSKDY